LLLSVSLHGICVIYYLEVWYLGNESLF